MKDLKYMIIALACTLFASCMGDGFADPDLSNSPYGNNELTESNVLTIAQLKTKYASYINNSTMTEVTEDVKVKGVVTGNDVGGNIYNEISIQDETGALLVCINQGGLYGYLPVGQEVLISLNGLMIGGYGQQLEIGGVYTNTKTGAQSIGRMSRYLWETHYKLIGRPDPSKVVPEVFDVTKISDANYLAANCGKLMTIKNVALKDANGKRVYAPDDGSVTLTANCANRAFKGISSSNLVLRTSTYADFANQVMPQEALNVTGIFTRYRNTWQILLRTIDDVTIAPQAILNEPFSESEGAFTIIDVKKPDELNYVWKWASANYGVKASAYLNSIYYESDSWLVSPSFNLSNANNATLRFDHVQRYGTGDDLHVMISASHPDGGTTIDASQWEELTLSQWPDGSSWDFITSEVSLAKYGGKGNVHIAFRYTSSSKAAATWEIKNLIIE